jgi:acyl dehydratase
MTRTVYAHLTDLQPLVGQEIGVGDWVVVDQQRIDRFAEATGDDQWIHVDPERATSGPFGATIAHGFLTLSLLPLLTAEALDFGDVRMGVNYGLNRVRFPAPVKVGSRVRARLRLLSYEAIEGGAQLVVEATVELEGSAKPACVAETVSRRFT